MKEKQWSLPLRYTVFVLLVIFLAVGLWYIRSVLQPLIVAAFVAYLISPAVNLLTRHTHLSRRAAVNLIFALTVLLLVSAPASMALFLDEFQQIIRDIGSLLNQVTTWMAVPRFVGGYLLDLTNLAARLEQFRLTFLSSLAENALQLIEQTSMGALWVLVTVVAVYYFLSEWPDLRRGFIQSFPPAFQPEMEELYRRVRAVWMAYLRGQLLLMLIVGVIFTVAWAVIGIPGALVLGILSGFLTLIPDVGPFLAALLAASVALLEGSSWMALPNVGVALIVVAVYLVLISVKNFWLRPLIMGRAVHMPEPLVFIFIILATVLWGILGALLVIPASASLAIVFDYLRRRVLGMTPFVDVVKETPLPKTPPASKPSRKREREKNNDES
jgi:predicted PurR-regulated permease PerM